MAVALPPSEPSVWSKLGMGALTGAMVGATIGTLFGTAAIVTRGAGPRGFLHSLSGYVIGSAATFSCALASAPLAERCSFFLSIGSVIRTDELEQDRRRLAFDRPSALRARLHERMLAARLAAPSRSS